MKFIFTIFIALTLSSKSQIGQGLGLKDFFENRIGISTDSIDRTTLDSLVKVYPTNDTLRIFAYLNDTSLSIDSINTYLKKEIGAKQTIIAYNVLINNYTQLQLNDSAKKYINLLLKIDRNNFHGRKNKALQYIYEGNNPRALAYLNKLHKEEPTSIDVLVLKATAYHEMNNISSAVLSYNKAIELDSNFVPALSGLLTIYTTLNEYYEAIKVGEKIVELSPDYYQSRNNLAYSYLQLKMVDSAIVHYKRSYMTYQPNAQAAQGLMIAYHAYEDMDSLCHYKNEYIKLLGSVRDSAQLTKKVNEHYGGYCLENSPEYYFQRGIACYNKKQMENAVDWYNQGLKKFPDDFYCLQFKGNALMALKKYDQAIIAFKKSISSVKKTNYKIKSPDRMKGNDISLIGMSYYTLAECFAHTYKEAEALAAITEFETNFGPGNDMVIPSKHQALMVLALNKNDYDEAYKNLFSTYQIALRNGGGLEDGLRLVAFIQELVFNNPGEIHTITVGFNNNKQPLISKSGSFKLKKDIPHSIKISQAFQIIKELEPRYPNHLNLILVKAYLNKKMGNPYCDEIRSLNYLGYKIFEDPYWQHCQN